MRHLFEQEKARRDAAGPPEYLPFDELVIAMKEAWECSDYAANFQASMCGRLGSTVVVGDRLLGLKKE